MPGWSRVAVVFVSCCVASPALALDVGLAPATQKILQDGVVPEGTSIALQACRGEWEGLQVVLLDDAGVSGVDLQLADLTGPDGARIPAADMRAYREWYLYIDDPSPGSVSLHEREVGWYPDPLIPLTDPWQEGAPVAAPFQLAAGETGAIFLDIPVAAGTPPGSYEGSITLLTDSQQVSLQVSLEVWELDIPADKTIGTAFHMSESVLRHFHGGADSEAAEGYDDIVDRYYIALHEHRLDPTWLGGAVDYSFDEEGVLQPVDWTEMDAALAPFLEGTLFPDGAPVTRFAVSGFQAGYGPGSRTEEEWAQEAAALAEHLDEEGWWSRFYSYSLDEPWLNGGDDAYQAIHDDAQLLMGASPLWEGHLLVTGPFDDRLAGDMGIWCPVTPMYEDWYWSVADYAGREEYAQRMALGEELWFYVCNANFPPYAGYDIDTPIGFEPRIVKWGSFYEGATGFLYWSTTYWVDDDPWNVYANLDQFGSLFARNGDGFLLNPGAPAVPSGSSSIRATTTVRPGGWAHRRASAWTARWSPTASSRSATVWRTGSCSASPPSWGGRTTCASRWPAPTPASATWRWRIVSMSTTTAPMSSPGPWTRRCCPRCGPTWRPRPCISPSPIATPIQSRSRTRARRRRSRGGVAATPPHSSAERWWTP